MAGMGRTCSIESRRKISIANSGENLLAFGKMKPESIEKARLKK
jgi:hypothetical protein